MFFLHAPARSGNSGAGLSSAVDGMMGVAPVVPMGGNAAALLDVRWLATRVRRAVGAPLLGAALPGAAGVSGVSEGGIVVADGVAVVRNWQVGSVAEPRGVRLPEGVVGQAERVGQGEGLGEGLGEVRRAGTGVGPGAGVVPVKEAGYAQR